MQCIHRRTKAKKSASKELFILILVLYGIRLKLAQLTAKEDAFSNITSSCLLNILQTYLNDSKKIALRFDQNQTHQLVVRDLFKLSQLPFMVNQDEVPKGRDLDTRIPCDVTVILSERLNITAYLERNLYNTRTVFLTVVWARTDRIRGVLREFFSFNIVNAFVLEVEEDKVNVHYFIPYAKCNDTEPIILDIWSGNRFKHGRIGRISNRYSVSSLNGCHFNVTVVHVPPTIIFPEPSRIHGSDDIEGIEGRILKTISKKINCRFTYKVPDDGEKWGFITPTPKGAVGDVFYKRSLCACGLTAPNVERLCYMDSIVGSSALSECISWLVPVGSGKGRPVWIQIYVGEFSIALWILILTALVLTLGCFAFFSWVEKSPVAFVDIFLILFSSSVSVYVKPPKGRTLKALFVAWIWYGFIIMTAYESAVKSRLTVPLLYRNIDNFRGLLESDLQLYGVTNTIKVIFQGNEDPDVEALRKRVKGTNSTIEEVVEKMLEDGLTGYLREYTTFLYNAYKNRKAIGKIHRVKQCAYEYYPTLYLQKRSPVTHVVKRVVSQLLETGILYRWRKWFLHETSSSSSTDHIKLTLRHMAAPFVAYLAGMSLSTLVFIIECVAYYLFRSSKRKFDDY